jgi:hypothetical protein
MNGPSERTTKVVEHLVQYTGIRIERIRQTTKAPISIADLMIDITTKNLTDKKQTANHYTVPLHTVPDTKTFSVQIGARTPSVVTELTTR